MNKAFLIARADNALRKGLSHVLPPQHFVAIYSRVREWFLDELSSCTPCVKAPRRPVVINGLLFRNDLGNAAGLDKNGDLLPFNYLMDAGFAIVGTILCEAHDGKLIRAYGKDVNPWTPLPYSQSAINTLGLPSNGVGYAAQRIIDFRSNYSPSNFPIGANVMPHQQSSAPQEGLEHAVRTLLPLVDFFEINESCPNAHQLGGVEERLAALVQIRDRYAEFGGYKPLFVKLRSAGDATHTVETLSRMGIDGVVLTNTQVDYSTLRQGLDERDLALFDHYTSKHQGGVSGNIIKERTFAEVERTIAATLSLDGRFHVIHVGGLSTPQDMNRSRALGAPLREWYTGFMHNLREDIYARTV